jgi:hypothetical protein
MEPWRTSARDEHSRLARLKRQGVASQRPTRRLGVSVKIGAGHEVAVPVAVQPALDAGGQRLSADQHVYRVDPQLALVAIAVGDGHGLKPGLAAGRDNAGACQDRDLRVRGDAVDEVARHARLQRVGTDDHRDRAGICREVQRCLPRRVRAADERHILLAMVGGLTRGRAVGDAAADELLDPRHVEAAVCDAGGDQAAPRA